MGLMGSFQLLKNILTVSIKLYGQKIFSLKLTKMFYRRLLGEFNRLGSQ